MKAAPWPRPRHQAERMLVIDAGSGALTDTSVLALPDQLAPGDLVVLNDASTLPASLQGTNPDGRPLEVRLSTRRDGHTWLASVLGAGDWRTPTEDRPEPPEVWIGDELDFAGLKAVVTDRGEFGSWLFELTFDAADDQLLELLYRLAMPVQYSYLDDDVPLAAVQTAYGSRPWAVEPASAGRPLRIETLIALRRRGVDIATLTHAAGLSATGDDGVDAALPLVERYEIPQSTVDAIRRTRAAGGRVLAVGTTVVRALEDSAARHGALVAGAGDAVLHIGPGFVPSVVDGILSGMHEPGASHFALLHAFARPAVLLAAYRHAVDHGYVQHEFGDSTLILRSK